MLKCRIWSVGLLVVAGCLVMQSRNCAANNIAVTNVSMVSGGDGYTYVQFDLSWDNSWRYFWSEGASSVTNWDAAWVFVKFRDLAGVWRHTTLATSGHTAPSGSTVDVGVTESVGKGVFIYRSGVGAGTNTFNEVKLRWNYAEDGVANTQYVDIAVFATEMVYITEGSFELGSGGAETAHFYEHPTATNTYTVSSEDAITVGTSAGNLYYTTGGDTGDGLGPISNAFPKGYAAFYCMKYEITQDQYTEFLNYLSNAQATNRYPNKNGNDRHTISGTHPNYTNTAPDRGCNYLSWRDGAAYADWACLRPMTELEFEKACRGPKAPVADEYAWGSIVITAQTNHIGDDGSGTETADPTNANCCYNNIMGGPVRVGIYATSSSTRESSGASYYGVMELSGNLRERPVTVGNPEGRSFTGNHGDGELTSAGEADATSWPGANATGSGRRGGDWNLSAVYLCVSARPYAAGVYLEGYFHYGWRGVRTAP